MKLTRLVPALWAGLVALAVASALVLLTGGSPLEVYRLLAAGTWRSAYGFGQVLFKSTPLVFSGLAVALGLRAGLFNIGVDGQLIFGAFATAMVGAYLPPGTPPVFAVGACLLAGLGGGALVALGPGLLKARTGAHEVITTIMLNFVVRAAMVGVGLYAFERETIHTRPIIAAARLPRLGRWIPALHGSAANASIFIAIVACLFVGWLLYRTRAGFALRALGQAPLAAETAGIAVGRMTILAMVVSGAVAGLCGSNFVLGYKHYYEDGFSGGVGFMGIAVAVLGESHPLGVAAAALVFGTLSQGALAVNAIVPKELVDVLQAVIIFAVAASSSTVRRLVLRGGR